MIKNIRRSTIYTVICVLFLSFSSTNFVGCKAKEGCGLEEKYGPRTNRDGSLSTKRGKSSLFSKKQRKKMRK